ncbi:MAG: GNAT family N-acetyltransferase [Sediminibacterium sp.]|nr:GNAT family N-acetyltransferase [uncultured Sediminibacterium sp.]
MIHALLNPVWEALSTHHSFLNQGNEVLKYYPGDICPFVALKNWDETDFTVLASQLPSNRIFSVPFAREIKFTPAFEVLFTIPLYQMVCHQLNPFENNVSNLVPLTKAEVPQMLVLTEKTKPGPFYQRTIEFGNYYGIFDGDKLVSMAGQRLQTNTHTEVSAICTDPDYLGRSYAKRLTSHICSMIIDAGKTPFLHVRQDNAAAIGLYKQLGFDISTEIFFAVFKKKFSASDLNPEQE